MEESWVLHKRRCAIKPSCAHESEPGADEIIA